MKSPFPGMDPFIEARGLWRDFCHGLIVEIDRHLNQNMPAGYVARLGHRCYIDRPLDDSDENEDYTWSRDDLVPLEGGDNDVPVPLQEIVAKLFDENRYFRQMRYSDPIDPPLSQEELDVLRRAL